MGLKAEQIHFFAKYIEENTGIVYRDTNIYQLETRLENVAKSLGFANSEELWQKSQQGIQGLFKQVLLDTATNNETSFFRDTKVFKAIESFCISEIQKLRPSALTYQLWSAACSTGQEPYTLSMIFAERANKGQTFNFNIWATDFSERVLNYAKAGVYSQLEVQRGLPTNLLLKYFSKNADDTWSIQPDLQKNIRFDRLNLFDPWPVSSGLFDIILCRNVLIYQSPENKKKVIEKMSAKLHPKGFLILGGAESMIGLSEDFNQLSIEGAVFYQKKV